MPSARVQLLGGFDASLDGLPVPESAWRLKKARELVKLLALAPGHRLHREQAMDFLWPDRDPAAAANNLNQAVHVARRALGTDAIAVRDDSLLLDAAAAARRAGTPAAHRAALTRNGRERSSRRHPRRRPAARTSTSSGTPATRAAPTATRRTVGSPRSRTPTTRRTSSG